MPTDPWALAHRPARSPSVPGRSLGTAVAAVACATLVSLVVGVPGAAGVTLGAPPPGAPVDVMVQGHPGAMAQVVAAVEAMGGTVAAELAVIDGVRASVPTGGRAALQAAPGGRDVTVDSSLVPLGAAWGDDTTGEGRRASLGSGAWLPHLDRGSTWSVAEQVGADDVWALPDPADPARTLTGSGVGVALVDTGVAMVEGLSTPGAVVRGPDLSFDSQADGTRSTDGMGHGTHMAGIIAGRDTGLRAGGEHHVRHFAGLAPGARVIDVKVGAGDGGVDVSQVVAGLDWVVANRARHNIRVVNLSYGTASTQPYRLDPLAHAVESAWHAGVVVVVAAGNDGESGVLPLTMPAADPYVIAVGSSDHRGSDETSRWRVGAWTNAGTEARRPDVLAPGKSVVSLRVPGSAADVQHPEGLVTGDRSGRFFRGTGTSQSAAVVSGAVALLLQADPRLTPDQVKGLLRSTTDLLPGDSSPVQGAGVIDVAAAVAAVRAGSVPAFTQTAPRSSGLGSIEASRAGTWVVDPADGSVLQGEQDIFGTAWDAATWAPLSTAGRSWSGGTFNGSTWTGSGWQGADWASALWSGRSWSGRSWSGRSWSGRSWSGRSWSGRSWSTDGWSTDGWSGRSWSGRSWSGRSWSTAGWS